MQTLLHTPACSCSLWQLRAASLAPVLLRSVQNDRKIVMLGVTALRKYRNVTGFYKNRPFHKVNLE